MKECQLATLFKTHSIQQRLEISCEFLHFLWNQMPGISIVVTVLKIMANSSTPSTLCLLNKCRILFIFLLCTLWLIVQKYRSLRSLILIIVSLTHVWAFKSYMYNITWVPAYRSNKGHSPPPPPSEILHLFS
jgi:hypothetical protein